MATAPMNPEMEEPLQPEVAELEETGFEIIIKVDGQGQISVGVEREGEAEVEGEAMGLEAETQFTPASSIREAMQIALDAYRAQGDMSASTVADDSFNAGFESRKPR